MRKTYLLATLIAIIGIIFPSALSATQPRLTVVVVVDGMTQDNLNLLRPFWSAGGLRTMSEEAFQTTIHFPHLVNGGQETTATLMTGTTPSRHGFMGDQYFDRLYRTTFDVLHDSQTSGIGTTLQLSPRAIATTTITDEWRILHGLNAKIYAIGLQPQATILLAGHAANACCWLDPTALKWVTTSCYSEGLPSAADAMNMSGRINVLAEKTWTPRLEIANYTSPTKDERRRSFSYLPKTDLLHTPAANTLAIELALSLQQTKELGMDNISDLLLLQLTTHSPKATSDAIASAEQEDMYLSINQDLCYLMDQLNQRIGKTNYQVLLIGRPTKGHSTKAFEMAGIPIQHFNLDRATALTSTYLMAIYGHERWIDGGFGPYIFLNRTLIEQKRLSLETIQRQVANFIMDFEGVQVAFPIHEAILSEYSPSIYRRQAGDVFFQLQDHWVLDTNNKQPYDQVIEQNPTAPLMLWSATLRTFPEKELDATDIKNLIINSKL